MKLPLKTYISILAFIWFGYVAGISFLEAPLKFQAPGITLPLGLGIGRLVFGTLNKVELFLAFAIGFISFAGKAYNNIKILSGFLFIILALQTWWLLPFLDARAEMIINGLEPPESNLHFIYIMLDVLKLILLFVTGHKNLQNVLLSHKSL